MSASQHLTNLADMVRDRAKTRGDALAYEFEGRRTSFAEFDIKTNRVANALKASGVKPAERITYLGKNSDFYFELLMGAMKANVVMAPVNWRLAEAFVIQEVSVALLINVPHTTPRGYGSRRSPGRRVDRAARALNASPPPCSRTGIPRLSASGFPRCLR